MYNSWFCVYNQNISENWTDVASDICSPAAVETTTQMITTEPQAATGQQSHFLGDGICLI